MAEELTTSAATSPTPAPAQQSPIEQQGGEATEIQATAEEEKPAGLMSAEGIIMMSVAGLLDLTGWVLVIFLLDDFFITDIIGTLIIGTWLFFRTGKGGTTSRLKTRAQKGLKKLFTGKWGKFLMPITNEIVPWWGGIVPSWTITVYFNLTS